MFLFYLVSERTAAKNPKIGPDNSSLTDQTRITLSSSTRGKSSSWVTSMANHLTF